MQINIIRGINNLHCVHAARSLPISLNDPCSFRSHSVGLIALKAQSADVCDPDVLLT